MSSKREEERNEKVIRGLMKLPPNRRCINCNSMGPQYVCTNFWTFVCMTCSGIHREFTHRVKSVSMAKFTSQEVEALQKGGNQRAREAYLKDWDPQRHKLPNSSNAEKVREFIKHVYVDRKYAEGKTSDRPPRETQNFGNSEDETRRASSYHSYSQSPPYDYQYEERRYGKQTPALTRKPGSDRGLYEGKVSNFSSPSRFSDQTLEDRFATENSIPRASDYSASSPGDPFRTDSQSPNLQRDAGYKSPPHQTMAINSQQVQHCTMNSFLESDTKENAEKFRRTQRATSSGSFGSFDSHSLSSFKSVVTLADLVSEPEQPVEVHQREKHSDSSLLQSSASGNFGGLDLFDTPFVPHNVAPAPSVDLFQLPDAQSRPPIDLFEQSSTSSVPGLNTHQPETIPSSLDFFSQMPQQAAATFDKRSLDESISKNDGWASFDMPQHKAPNDRVVNSAPNGGYVGKVEPHPLPSTGMQWPVFGGTDAHVPSPAHTLWHGEPYQSQVSVPSTQQSWDAFEDPNKRLPYSSMHQSGIVDGHAPATAMGRHLGMEAQSHALDRKSSNPFDLSDDFDFQSSSMFLDMNSLQAALPGAQLPNTLVDDATQSWFPHNPVPHYIPAAQGALGFMGGQAPSGQMLTVPAQEPVASVGGNPFA